MTNIGGRRALIPGEAQGPGSCPSSCLGPETVVRASEIVQGKTVDSDQNTERRRWDGEEGHPRNGLAIVSEERQPSVHGIWISRGSPDRLRDTPFRDVETQFDHFAVNARRMSSYELPKTELLGRQEPPHGWGWAIQC